MHIGYARVSSTDQTLDTQVEQLTHLGCEKLFCEQASGRDSERTELKALIEYAREGDTIHVMKVDRLARNTIDALQIADTLAAKGAGLVFHDLGNVDINSDVGRVIYTTISAFAEMERKRILQRCNEGRERARAEGKHLGRFPDAELHGKILRLSEQGMNKHAISKQLGCSRTTVYKVLDMDNFVWNDFGILSDVSKSDTMVFVCNSRGEQRKMSITKYKDSAFEVFEKAQSLKGKPVQLRTSQNTAGWSTNEWFSGIELS
ncbi:resolvase/integrase Bin [Photobacterium gaetbulicola]|nr:resolvase/integrase Bin [Photobacterium gaetbulicola]